MSKYPDTDSISCPTMLYVPDEAVSTVPPITPVPGKDGATGETGNNVSGATCYSWVLDKPHSETSTNRFSYQWC